MTDFDTLLARLGEEPADARFDGFEARVMSGLALRREQSVARRGYLLACGLAIVVGTVASAMPGARNSAEPLLGMPATAPSHLLVD